MAVRRPIVAGRFYPASREECLEALDACAAFETAPADLPARCVAGIVPHAGWICSGRVAARVFAALARRIEPAVIVLVGAVHQWPGRQAALFRDGHWETPIGTVSVDRDLASRVLVESPLIVEEPDAHDSEHSLEVQMPFVRRHFSQSAIVPIMVPPMEDAIRIGEAIGRAVVADGRDVAIIGTTDLTHYGPSYGFEPEGRGEAGIRWAKETNDRRLIEQIERMNAEGVLSEAEAHRNACGAGAVACTITAAKALGATVATVLEHTTSHEVLGGRAWDSVGYVGAVLGMDQPC